MQIRARMSTSADGYVTTPGGWPALTADPALRLRPQPRHPGIPRGVRGSAHGPHDVRACPGQRPPWPDLDVYVLASHRPAGTPDHVVTDSDPRRLLDTLRAANRGGDVHLVGGPHTIQAYLALGALDRLELVVLPLLFGPGCS